MKKPVALQSVSDTSNKMKRKPKSPPVEKATEAGSPPKKKKASTKSGDCVKSAQKKTSSTDKGEKVKKVTVKSTAGKYDTSGSRKGGAETQKKEVVLLNKKETREKMKETKEKRKSVRDNYAESVELKKIWELLRMKKEGTGAESKDALIKKILKIIKGREKQFLFAHDTSRVLQSVHKYGSMQRRTEFFECVKTEVLAMAKSKYAAPLVKRMVKRGSGPQKRFIIGEFMKNARSLLKHKLAGCVIEYLYNMYANAAERHAFTEQFYGPTYRLLSTAENTNSARKSLSEVLAAEPLHRESIMRHLRDALLLLVKKDSALTFTLCHSLLLDYFLHASTDEDRAAMAEAVAEFVPAVLHTREGARACMHAVWHGSARARKTIVKSLKEDGLAIRAAKEEHGHLVLLAIFDAVDDTKLVSKAIIAPLMSKAEELAEDKYGRRVFHYLLQARDSQHIPPDAIQFLVGGDANATSKKDTATRRRELAEGVGPELSAFVVGKLDEEALGNGPMMLLAQSVGQYAVGLNASQAPGVECMKALAMKAVEELVPGEGHIVEDAGAHVVFKKLLVFDKERAPEEEKFADILLECVPKESICSFLECNRGCFLLLSVYKAGVDSATKKLNAVLKGKKKALGKKAFKGASLLLEQMSS